MQHFITDFILKHGYEAVFVLMVLESACIPIPSEVTMLFGGALANATFDPLAVHYTRPRALPDGVERLETESRGETFDPTSWNWEPIRRDVGRRRVQQRQLRCGRQGALQQRSHLLGGQFTGLQPPQIAEREKCYRASAGHPNPSGAIQYKNQILAAMP